MSRRGSVDRQIWSQRVGHVCTELENLHGGEPRCRQRRRTPVGSRPQSRWSRRLTATSDRGGRGCRCSSAPWPQNSDQGYERPRLNIVRNCPLRLLPAPCRIAAISSIRVQGTTVRMAPHCEPKSGPAASAAATAARTIAGSSPSASAIQISAGAQRRLLYVALASRFLDVRPYAPGPPASDIHPTMCSRWLLYLVRLCGDPWRCLRSYATVIGGSGCRVASTLANSGPLMR